MTGEKMDAAAAVRAAKKFPGLKGMDLAKVVTTKRQYQWNEGSLWQPENRPVMRAHQRLHVVAYDYGVKRNILRMLGDRGCRMTVVPAQTSAEDVLALEPDGVFLSNGPGDPEPCDYAIEAIRALIVADLPTFGICLGHQLLGLASGARTMKMKFGHHGANHPVQDLETGRVFITSQNHGFAVDETDLPSTLKATHRSLFDGSLQGIARIDRPAFSFQGHPEASPGPQEMGAMFDRFVHLMLRRLQQKLRGRRAASRRRTRPPEARRQTMPKRTDIESILIIGAGPIVIGQACEFDYSGAQACKALKEEGYRVILVNSNPATIMTDPEMADSIYIEPINWRTLARIIEKEEPDALLPTMGGQTALNTALDLVREGVLARHGVELIAASREAIDMAEDRELFRNAMREIGLECPRAAVAHTLAQAMEIQQGLGFPVRHPAFVHHGRLGRRHRLQPRGVRADRRARPRCVADFRSAHRRIGDRLERIRDGSRSRQERQLHHRLLDRKPRSHGRAHRRLDHRRAGADADRQGIPAHAQRVDRGAAQDRRRNGRLERAVRREPQGRPPAGHRDESARVALLGAGIQGHRFSDRQDRRQARGGLHAR